MIEMNSNEALAEVFSKSSLTLSQLSRAVGVKPPVMHRKMHGTRISGDSLSECCGAMGWSVILVPSEQDRFMPDGSIKVVRS